MATHHRSSGGYYELAVVLLLFAAVAVAALVELGPGTGWPVACVLALLGVVMFGGEWDRRHFPPD